MSKFMAVVLYGGLINHVEPFEDLQRGIEVITHRLEEEENDYDEVEDEAVIFNIDTEDGVNDTIVWRYGEEEADV